MRNALSLIAITLLLSVVTHAADDPAPAANVPSHWMTEPAFPSSHVEHLRLDDSEIEKVGGGSFEKGLNLIGGGGFRLFGVTTGDEKGGAGWHLFKRGAWNAPVPRQRFEYKRIDTGAIETLGDGKFAPGLQKIEEEHWELVAYTTGKAGQIGWYYFERPVGQ